MRPTEFMFYQFLYLQHKGLLAPVLWQLEINLIDRIYIIEGDLNKPPRFRDTFYDISIKIMSRSFVW